MNVSERDTEFPFLGKLVESFFFFFILGSGSLEECLFCKILWGFIAKEF